jgi:phage-related protein
MRYQAVSALENALDVQESDPDMAMLEICNALPSMLHYYFLKQGKYVQRHKDTLQEIRASDPELAHLIHTLFTADLTSRVYILHEIADRTIEKRRFFEYAWRDENI